MKPRVLTEADLPWLYDLCVRRYSAEYDPVSTEQWYRNQVLKSPMFFCAQRTDNAFCISALTALAWLPNQFNVNVAFICADDGAMWEAVCLLRSSIAWARSRKATTWAVASDTSTDLKMLAYRLGATEIHPRYVIRFDNG